jgi:drug/metabolite transporter (DMT)-like permease
LTRGWAFVLALLAVLGVSASGPLMAATAAPALAIAFWRNAMASAVLVPVAAATSRRQIASLGRRHQLLAVVAGVMLAAHFAAWVSSLKLTSVASATALCMTQLLWVVGIERLRGVRVPPLTTVGVALSGAGVLVVSGVDFTLSTRALLGDVLAVIGGLFAGLYFIAGQAVRPRLGTTPYAALCFGTCAVVLLGVCVITGTPLAGYSPRDWLLIAAVALVAQLIAHSLLNHLLIVMNPTRISMLLLLEVPGAALLAAWFLGQAPPLGVYLGLALILVGLAVVTVRRPATASPDL